MKQHAARAMLLLVKAAMTDDHNLVLKLFGEVGGAPPGVDCSDEEFADGYVRQSISCCSH